MESGHWRDSFEGMFPTNAPVRIAAVSIVLLLLGAAPPPQVVSLGSDSDEALIIPADSPIKFERFDKYGVAHFAGRFTLTGTFSYSCTDCEPGARNPPLKRSDFHLEIVPDAALAARLPRWKMHRQDMIIEIRGASRLTDTIGNRQQRAALLRGKVDALHGRVAIVVGRFRTDIECDSAGWWANLVAVARAPKLSANQLKGNFGCA